MKKKLLAFVMAATMVFSLAACGSSNSNDSSNSGDSSDSDSAQSGDEVQTFKLGSIGPLTGDAAIYGQAVVQFLHRFQSAIHGNDLIKCFFFQKGAGESQVQLSARHDQTSSHLFSASSKIFKNAFTLAAASCL